MNHISNMEYVLFCLYSLLHMPNESDHITFQNTLNIKNLHESVSTSNLKVIT
ncbi:hypothetical protein HanRHA438_Chr15g0717311 [Helianthus annuus]|nr:hypothetical protein HanRHA438_Chr15g0717311 [Helianthus annuus]